MVSSVEFPKTGNGYIYQEYEKPVKPNKRDSDFNSWDFKTHEYVFNEEKYNQSLAEYKEELKVYNKHKGEFKLPCAKLMVGRKFNFVQDKINVIFGPNGSGKTTILKAIAGTALVKDGFSSILEPVELFGFFNKRESVANVKEKVAKAQMNSVKVDWDGVPIYYHNFESRSGHSIGDLTGSVLSNTMEEVSYIWMKDRISLGQKSAFMIKKLQEIAQHPTSMENILKVKGKRFLNANDSWQKAFRLQEQYYSKFDNYTKVAPITMLFDELDKSLDIANVWCLYTNFLPGLFKTTGVQIIIISHNPLILTNAIMGSDLYNVVSMDEDYTKRALDMLSNVTFGSTK